MTPVEKLNRIKQSICVNTIEKFPENVFTKSFYLHYLDIDILEKFLWEFRN